MVQIIHHLQIHPPTLQTGMGDYIMMIWMTLADDDDESLIYSFSIGFRMCTCVILPIDRPANNVLWPD